MIKDLFGPDETWAFHRFSFPIPDAIRNIIISIPRSSPQRSDNVLRWSHTNNGDFSSKTAYDALIREEDPQDTVDYGWIWKSKTCQRVKHFLWLTARERLPTKHLLLPGKIEVDPKTCQKEEEDVSHILKDCPIARPTWTALDTVWTPSQTHGQTSYNGYGLAVPRLSCLISSEYLGTPSFPSLIGLYGGNETRASLTTPQPSPIQESLNRAKEFATLDLG